MAEFLPPTTEQTIQYLEDEVSRVRAALVTSRERHAADARDLEQLRVTVRDESARAHAAEVEMDALRAEVERLNGWMQKIEGGDTPCKDESRLRQWAYEALILRRQPE